MNIKYTRVFYVLLLLIYLVPVTVFAADNIDLADDLAAYDEPDTHISDPLEPMNRVIFKFNDKVYFYLLKPAAKTWSFIVPQEIRASLWSAFKNLLMPVRVVNDLLQGRFYESGIEVSRFVLNSTVGVVGLGDPAKYVFKLESSDEDFGQTIGAYGAGEGMYLYLPFLGPSNLRDTVGQVGDSFLDPLNYMTSDWKGTAAIHTGKRVNHTSLNIGEYEQFKEEAFDPYVAMREFYTKYRRKKIANRLIHWRLAGGTNKKAAIVKVQDEPLVKTPEPSVRENKQRYYVQVGVFFDRESMSDMNLKLASAGEKAVVATYQRDDYAFYGLQVPAGSSFEDAKRVEGEIISKGFTETTVLRRAASATPSSIF